MMDKTDKNTLKQFKKLVLDNFSKLLRQYNFHCEKERMEQYFYEITYAKEGLYIKFIINIKPQDYPPYFNILLGEGSIDYPEADWNCIALWHYLERAKEANAIKKYSSEGLLDLEKSLKIVKDDLLKYGIDFLSGNLSSFYELRKSINRKRQPYKIYTKNKDGAYSKKYDEESMKLKEKYS